MKKQNHHLYLLGSERRFIIENLVWFRNKLRKEGRYTDAVDDLIIKFSMINLRSLPKR